MTYTHVRAGRSNVRHTPRQSTVWQMKIADDNDDNVRLNLRQQALHKISTYNKKTMMPSYTRVWKNNGGTYMGVGLERKKGPRPPGRNNTNRSRQSSENVKQTPRHSTGCTGCTGWQMQIADDNAGKTTGQTLRQRCTKSKIIN